MLAKQQGSLAHSLFLSRKQHTHTRHAVSSRCARISPWLAGAHSTMLKLPEYTATTTTRSDGVATGTRCCCCYGRCDVVAASWLRSRAHTSKPARWLPRTHVHVGAADGLLMLRPARRATALASAGRRGGEPRHPGALPNDHCLSATPSFLLPSSAFVF